MGSRLGRAALLVAVTVLVASAPAAAAAPEGQPARPGHAWSAPYAELRLKGR